MGSWIELSAADGHGFKAWESRPVGTPKGALIIGPEIFGINSHIRSVADGYAADGYLALAPALFDRAQRDFEVGYTAADVDAGRNLMQKLSLENALIDIVAGIQYLAPAGKVGIVGYCWGGTLAWAGAARLPELAAAVSYYGGGVAGLIGEKPRCPTICHFAEQDQHPTLAQAQAVAAAHPDVPAYYYPAGHGFNCDQRASYHDASAKLAKSRTLEFLGKHLG